MTNSSPAESAIDPAKAAALQDVIEKAKTTSDLASYFWGVLEYAQTLPQPTDGEDIFKGDEHPADLLSLLSTVIVTTCYVAERSGMGREQLLEIVDQKASQIIPEDDLIGLLTEIFGAENIREL